MTTYSELVDDNKKLLESTAGMVAKMIVGEAAKCRFIEQMNVFCEMVEQWTEKIEEYWKLNENDPALQKAWKIIRLPNKQTIKRTGLTWADILPKTKANWRRRDIDFLSYTKSARTWRGSFFLPPVDELPPNPTWWLPCLDLPGRTRVPESDKDKLLRDYVLLSVIHDEYFKKQTVARLIYLGIPYRGRQFDRDKFSEGYGFTLRMSVFERVENFKEVAGLAVSYVEKDLAERNILAVTLLRKTQLSIDDKACQVRYDDQVFEVTERQATFLKSLYEKRGEWVAGAQLKDYTEERIDKVKKELPEPLLCLIESHTRKGYKLKL